MKDTKINEVHKAMEAVRNHEAYNELKFELKDFLGNLEFFISDFKYGEISHVQDWLKVYDVEALYATETIAPVQPVQLYPVINPDYLSISKTIFAKEFAIIKSFIEFVRSSI